MKKRKIISFLLAFFFLFSSLRAGAKCAECLICSALAEDGFPPSYRTALCALKREYPAWRFIPLFVTALSREKGEAYTFSYVLDQECRAARSLVSAKEAYAPYWGSTEKLYDRGFYQASREAVAYFLDPRNFLSQEDIFQFFLLTGGENTTKEEVEAVLRGCVGENFVTREGKSLAQVLLEAGRAFGVHPLHLAARFRQEQGQEGNALFWGNAGETVGDESFSGLFNPFNLSAAGTGEGEILRSGARYAEKMGWDSLEKGLFFGAEVLATEYVSSYQNTLYLQKWNVDPRSENDAGSRNFWAQYMQNIGGAKTEGAYLSSVLAGGEGEKVFLIPVYDEMPEENSPDPAGGECALFASSPVKNSLHLYKEEEGGEKEILVAASSAPREKREWRLPPLAFLLPPLLAAGVIFSGKRAKRVKKRERLLPDGGRK